MVVVLLHEGAQDFFVFLFGLALRIYWVVEGADHLSEELDGNGVIEVVVKG